MNSIVRAKWEPRSTQASKPEGDGPRHPESTSPWSEPDSRLNWGQDHRRPPVDCQTLQDELLSLVDVDSEQEPLALRDWRAWNCGYKPGGRVGLVGHAWSFEVWLIVHARPLTAELDLAFCFFDGAFIEFLGEIVGSPLRLLVEHTQTMD